MSNRLSYEARRERIIAEINQNLDFLVGSISSKGPQSDFYNLTSKVNSKTRSRSIPKDLLAVVRLKCAKHKKIKKLFSDLDEINWQMLREGIL